MQASTAANKPSTLAHTCRVLGEYANQMREMKKTRMACRTEMATTRTASRHCGFLALPMGRVSSCEEENSTGSRGKKTRKRSMLCAPGQLYSERRLSGRLCTYMAKKHVHCMPTCAIPSRPAAQLNVLFTRQHSTSAWLCRSSMMLAMADVPDVVPSRTNQGDKPSDERRVIIRACCGR